MKGNILVYNRLLVRVKEELKDTKGVIRIRKSKKNRQHNAVIKFPTIVYCKKKGQTTQWPKEGQTTQWPKEKVQKEQTTIYKTYI